MPAKFKCLHSTDTGSATRELTLVQCTAQSDKSYEVVSSLKGGPDDASTTGLDPFPSTRWKRADETTVTLLTPIEASSAGSEKKLSAMEVEEMYASIRESWAKVLTTAAAQLKAGVRDNQAEQAHALSEGPHAYASSNFMALAAQAQDIIQSSERDWMRDIFEGLKEHPEVLDHHPGMQVIMTAALWSRVVRRTGDVQFALKATASILQSAEDFIDHPDTSFTRDPAQVELRAMLSMLRKTALEVEDAISSRCPKDIEALHDFLYPSNVKPPTIDQKREVLDVLRRADSVRHAYSEGVLDAAHRTFLRIARGEVHQDFIDSLIHEQTDECLLAVLASYSAESVAESAIQLGSS
ncbi:uncharacterized protein MKK02DRAFT_41059 [Dioszegia hungarica]|uniref:Uncharacterized protein n=1 Tax=Dioszegia hungarica TaxID=4972 RepID=A0AA38H1B7_9TREE|nr:uncharacterized protein MKK02DRAFT_41059 [Dioszegia hungarica]KAI9632747.1 hypothetical protein MKK02DRAFT_41059 [Dioszegia hungarica]